MTAKIVTSGQPPTVEPDMDRGHAAVVNPREAPGGSERASLATGNQPSPDVDLLERLVRHLSTPGDQPAAAMEGPSRLGALRTRPATDARTARLQTFLSLVPPDLFVRHASHVLFDDWIDLDALERLLLSGPKAVRDELNDALCAYADKDFAFRPADEKKAVIETMSSVASEQGQRALLRLHLGRRLFGNRGDVLRYSVERESEQSGIVAFYRPLAIYPKKWEAMPISDRVEWFEENKTSRPTMVRLPDAPAHFREKLEWTGSPGVWELSTASSYESLDQLFRAMDQLAEMELFGGTHLHVTWLPEQDDALADVGEEVAGLIQQLDLLLHLIQTPHRARAFSHRMLSVQTEESLSQVVELLKGIRSLADTNSEFLKYRKIAFRIPRHSNSGQLHGRPYGDHRVRGLEVRGVLRLPDGDETDARYRSVAGILSDALATGDFEPFTFIRDKSFAFPNSMKEVIDGFCREPGARDLGIEKKHLDTFLRSVQYPYGSARESEPFDQRVWSPMYPWERLPFVPVERHAGIAEARQAFLTDLGSLVNAVSRLEETGRHIDWSRAGRELYELLNDWAWRLKELGVQDCCNRHLAQVARLLSTK